MQQQQQGNIETSSIVDDLILEYTKLALATTRGSNDNPTLKPQDIEFLEKLQSQVLNMYRYQDPTDLDKALDAIDLGKIYEGVDKREVEEKAKNPNSKLAHEDFIVLELLDYYKNHFFKWVNQPKCVQCHQDGDNMKIIGVRRPTDEPNPKQISNIECYICTTCNKQAEFPRINNPVTLLETRSGRCGEWVNCFILILQALLGPDQHIRYVWNYEDHVWCEYYSNALQKWVHLDPCEGVFDEPLLYCNNWGKKMSWVFGFGLGYMIDLSPKYITPEKQINQLEIVSSFKLIKLFIKYNNIMLLREYYTLINGDDSPSKLKQLYRQVLLRHNIECSQQRIHNPTTKTSSVTQNIPLGRQSGSATWTKDRGESGK